MAIKTGIILYTLILGSLAIPTPESGDLSVFFENGEAGTRIVGGTVAAPGSHPHMVAIIMGRLLRSFICGGSIIATRSVLTAAHCIDAIWVGTISNQMSLNIGSNRWNTIATRYRVIGNATHPHYVPNIIKNDIGILYTEEAIVYNDLVQPIPLNFDFIGAGVRVKAAGWGRIRTNGPVSANLLELTVTTIPGEQCVADAIQSGINLNMRPPPVEPHIELCTFHSHGNGMCRGDSGSALVLEDKGAQVGVVSWGFPCARGAPDVFVRLSAFEAWVAFHTRY